MAWISYGDHREGPETMSMHVNLPPEMERLQAWRAAVRVGEEELDRGEGVTYTRAALDEIAEMAIGGQRGDEPISRDVLP